MKRLLASVFVVFMAVSVSAHGDTHTNLPEPGTAPGTALFGLEKAQESISLALTFNKEKKVKKRLKISEERLAEAKKLSTKNDSESAEKAVQMHTKAIENAEKAIQKLPEERKEELNEEVKRSREKSISTLEDLKQKLPESAMKGIDTAITAHKQKGLGNKSGSSEDVLDRQYRGQKGYMATGRVMKSTS